MTRSRLARHVHDLYVKQHCLQRDYHYAARQTLPIINTHHLQRIREFGDQIWVFKHGVISMLKRMSRKARMYGEGMDTKSLKLGDFLCLCWYNAHSLYS